jgi:hypothetical protein
MPALICEGLLADTPEGRICLTTRGRLVADAVGSEIMSAFAPQTVSS